MKRCLKCRKPIDVKEHPYANIYPRAQSNIELNQMESYHLQCLVQKIREEDREIIA